MISIVIHGTGRMAAAIAMAVAARGDVSIAALVGPQMPEWETEIPWFSALADLPGRSSVSAQEGRR